MISLLGEKELVALLYLICDMRAFIGLCTACRCLLFLLVSLVGFVITARQDLQKQQRDKQGEKHEKKK